MVRKKREREREKAEERTKRQQESEKEKNGHNESIIGTPMKPRIKYRIVFSITACI